MTYSCVRVKKIKSATDAQNLTRHGQRAKGSFKASAVDLDRSHLNGHFVFDADAVNFKKVDECPDYRELLDTATKRLNAKRPKNGVFGTEMMFTASPDLFKDKDGNVDIDHARAWGDACLELARDKYGAKCVAARLDLDETTPHLSVFILPTYRKSYSGEKRKSTSAGTCRPPVDSSRTTERSRPDCSPRRQRRRRRPNSYSVPATRLSGSVWR